MTGCKPAEIVWVDEDWFFIKPLLGLFNELGFSTKKFKNATDAYIGLVNLNNNLPKCIIIDVMLDAGTDNLRFSEENCGERFQTTGLRLIEELTSNGSRSLFPNKVVLLTGAAMPHVLIQAEEFAKEYGIGIEKKGKDFVPEVFISDIIARIINWSQQHG